MHENPKTHIPTVYLVVPCYNEEAAIRQTVAGFQRTFEDALFQRRSNGVGDARNLNLVGGHGLIHRAVSAS